MNLFSSLGLRPEIIEAVTQLGFQEPTPIQQEAIPVLLGDKVDFIGLAQTGTGKTAAFGLPLLQHVDFTTKQLQGLVLCPTRELCLQVKSDLENFSSRIPGARIAAVYGGASISGQLAEVKKGVQIVVATPGRLMDMMERKAIMLNHITKVVLDEADEMLNMGFREDIDFILSHTTDEKNVWLFSATMPAEVRQIASRFMHKPYELTVGTKNTTAANIKHVYYITRANNKYSALKRIIDFQPEIFGLVFTQTKMDAQDVAEKLIKEGYNADALHGDLSQQQRDKVMARFRQRSLQLLVATDVAARGIDVNDISHVINYSVPDDLESYTHRSGRTARAGKTGVSISIIHSREIGKIRQIERMTKSKFELSKIPSGVEVCEKQLFHIVNNVHTVEVQDHAIDPYLPQIMEELKDLSREEVIKRFASLEFNRFLNYYKSAPDLNYDASQPASARETGDFTRLFVSVGTLDGFERGNLFKYLLDCTRFNRDDIGRISLKNSYSFVEVNTAKVDEFNRIMSGETYRGRPVRVEVSGEEPGGGKRERRPSSGGRRDFGSGGGGGRGRGGERDGSRSGGGSWGEKKKSSGSSWGDKKKSSGGGGGNRSGGGGWGSKSSGKGKRKFGGDSYSY